MLFTGRTDATASRQPLWTPVSTEAGVQRVLRVALAACYIGHGAFGIITKADWLPYFAVAGIPEWLAWRLMPVIGAMDITLGLMALFVPIRGLVAWAIVWCTWTAVLRPLAGQGIWEFLDRAGNYGVPLALLYLSGLRGSLRAWLHGASPMALDALRAERLAGILRVTTACLMIGHGGFGVFLQKQAAWTHYFGVLGVGPDVVRSMSLIPLLGGFEIVLGLAVLIRPSAGLLMFVVAWKLGTELLRLPAGEPIWEVVERGGSYGAPLAWLLLDQWRVRRAVAPLARPLGAPRRAAPEAATPGQAA